MTGKLTKAAIDRAKPKADDYFLWDGELKGFGIKIARGGRKSYVCKYRAGSGRAAPTRRMTIGAHGSPWTVDQARAEVRKLLGRAANGEDPAKEKQEVKKQITVAALCDLYLEQGIGMKKASTIATDRGRIERHIKPLLGKKRVPDVNRADIKRFLQDVANGKTAADIKTGLHGRAIVKGGKGTASRTVGLLGGIFSYAFDCGLIETNPVRGIKRFAEGAAMAAGLHLFDPESGEFNLPALAAGLAGPRLARAGVVLVEWAWRQQGLVVAAGNPHGVTGLGDLRDKGLEVMCRQVEAGSHLLLAHLLEREGMTLDDLDVVDETARGETDLGLAILEGRAEVGLAVEAVARSLKLGFVPLRRERYDLLLGRRDYFEPPLQKLFAFARGPAFGARAAQMGGYDVSGLGKVRYNGP